MIEGTAAETTKNPAETTENRGESVLAVPGSQRDAVQKPTEEAAQKPTDGASDTADTVAAVDDTVAVAAVAPHARGVATRWNPSDASMVAQVKSALHTSTAPGGVRCREAERKRVVDIIQRSLKSGRSASVYVCGLPGTGKSLTVSEAEKVARSWGDGSALGGGSKRALARADRPRVAAVNCMALAEPRHVFARIIEELGGTPPSASSESGASGAAEAADVSQLPEVAALRALVVDRAGAGSGSGAGLRTSGVASGGVSAGSHGPMTVILLDEMDQLVSKAQGILYELFGLPTLAKSRCVVVGVANGINLVEVTLPRLAARGCEPAVVRFNAYDRDQLKLLLRQRLGSLPWTVFEDAGLELCSRKVAAATGDMRRALNICAAAVDLCAREANEAAAKTEDRETAGAGSAEGISPSRRRARTAASASLVKISHMGARHLGVVFIPGGGHHAGPAAASADGALRRRAAVQGRDAEGGDPRRAERYVHGALQGGWNSRVDARGIFGRVHGARGSDAAQSRAGAGGSTAEDEPRGAPGRRGVRAAGGELFQEPHRGEGRREGREVMRRIERTARHHHDALKSIGARNDAVRVPTTLRARVSDD